MLPPQVPKARITATLLPQLAAYPFREAHLDFKGARSVWDTIPQVQITFKRTMPAVVAPTLAAIIDAPDLPVLLVLPTPDLPVPDPPVLDVPDSPVQRVFVLPVLPVLPDQPALSDLFVPAANVPPAGLELVAPAVVPPAGLELAVAAPGKGSCCGSTTARRYTQGPGAASTRHYT